ncbi:hypothetical protein W97_04267 [Coniosporium apollinis CBS 100218]|uniref:Uncharacterized protein n=1 Tax=Coniosporium apollinis (strain CBS 100218) TaxID=1168221 RepID=R7YSY2_CONA1|nr:uncharacterized protein W97_04267 [Coniosporium apollinis CBS 100218]EON65032.1 hypothetical protein W97_04267 [Coniosporium apollinis CBS 100218]
MATTATSKPALSALKTPMTATYPSEVCSPISSTPTWIKREDSLKTPITPPSAYLDFLKALSPALMSPLPTGASTRFTFGEKNEKNDKCDHSDKSSSATPVPAPPSDKSSPAPSQPPLSRTNSNCSCKTGAETSNKPTNMQISIPPPSAFVRPLSARAPRQRLHIPQSPYSPAGVGSPMSARSVHSPYSATISPREWDLEGKKGGTRAVSIRQVVTRTVTYSRTPVEPTAPLDPAPKGKRRKIEE